LINSRIEDIVVWKNMSRVTDDVVWYSWDWDRYETIQNTRWFKYDLD